MLGFLRKIYDPYKTIKHVSYRQMRAEYKRQELRFVRFWTAAFWTLIVAMTILFFAERLVRLAP
jgi:hypothetical protein